MRRSLGVLVLLGLGILAACLWLDRVSVIGQPAHPGFERAIRAVFRPLEAALGPVPELSGKAAERQMILFLLRGFLPAFVCYLGACAWVLQRERGEKADRVLPVVIGFSVLFRLVLAPFPPMLETDHHRYHWDGAVSAHRINPYKYAPSEIANLAKPGQINLYTPAEQRELDQLGALAQDPRLAEHFKTINHPKVPTLYPPLAQVLFSVAWRLGPGSDVVLKLLVVGVDLLLLGVLVLVLLHLGRDPAAAVVYGWSPLVLKEYANTGHFDPLATLMVMLGVLLLMRGRTLLAAIALGLGGVAKLYPLVVAVVLARRLGFLGLVVVGLVVAGFYAPHLSLGTAAFDGLVAYGSGWEFNSGVFAIVDAALERVTGKPWVARVYLARRGSAAWTYSSDEIVIDSFLMAKAVCGLAGLAFVLALAWRGARRDEELAALPMASMAAMVLLAPVSDPWYYGWIMPFVALFPAGSWIYLSGTMVLYYLFFWEWRYLTGMRPLEYGPFYAMLAHEQRERLRRASGAMAMACRWLAARLAAEWSGLVRGR